MDVPEVMSGLGNQLRTISGLRVRDYPSDSTNPPEAIVSFPENIEYDTVMARGADRLVFPVTVLVGRVSDRTARTRLGDYLSGEGDRSVKAAIEADKTLGGAADTTRVMEADTAIWTMGGSDLLAATFTIEVIA